MKGLDGRSTYQYSPPPIDTPEMMAIAEMMFCRDGSTLPGLDEWKQSVYYWWWEYLKRNKDYGHNHNLYSDFGDIKTDFDKWWLEKGEYLFADPTRSKPMVERIFSLDELPDGVFEDQTVMVVMVSLDQSVTETKQLFGHLLDSDYVGTEPKQGIRTARDSQARYPVVGQPNVVALEKTLAAYDYRLANPDMKLWQIWLALNPQLLNDKDPDKMTWAATVSRYLKKATAMIKNTGHGRFPDLS